MKAVLTFLHVKLIVLELILYNCVFKCCVSTLVKQYPTNELDWDRKYVPGHFCSIIVSENLLLSMISSSTIGHFIVHMYLGEISVLGHLNIPIMAS